MLKVVAELVFEMSKFPPFRSSMHNQSAWRGLHTSGVLVAVAHPLWGYPRVFYEIFTVRVTVTSVRQGSKVDLHENPAVSNVTTCCAAAAAAVAAITHGPSTSASSRPTQCSTARPPRKMKTGVPPPIILRPATL